MHAMQGSASVDGPRVSTFICDVELASKDVGVLVLAVRPGELARRTVPEGPHL